MLENIAIWGGIVGAVVSIIALLGIYFVKKNINDILNKNVILFDQNFELKKQAIEKSFKLLDDLESNSAIGKNAEFVRRAKENYNELLCVLNDIKLAETFYSLALKGAILDVSILTKYKLDCRHDIGLRMKGAKHVKHSTVKQINAQTKSTSVIKKESTQNVENK